MIRVVLAEDHQMVRQGLKLLLETEKSFHLVGEASDGLEAVQLVEQHQPDVLVLDLMIPRLHGLEVTRQIRRDCPKTKVVILSMHADPQYVREALRNGASGYVLKDGTGGELVQAIKTVRSGRRYLSPVLAERAIDSYLERQTDNNLDIYETLTNRERLVLQLAAEGASNPMIAKKLFISPRTAETHRANLMQKLDLHSQTDLVRFAIRKGIITA